MQSSCILGFQEVSLHFSLSLATGVSYSLDKTLPANCHFWHFILNCVLFSSIMKHFGLPHYLFDECHFSVRKVISPWVPFRASVSEKCPFCSFGDSGRHFVSGIRGETGPLCVPFTRMTTESTLPLKAPSRVSKCRHCQGWGQSWPHFWLKERPC